MPCAAWRTRVFIAPYRSIKNFVDTLKACPQNPLSVMQAARTVPHQSTRETGLAMKSIKEVFADWKENIRPLVVAQYGADDITTALRLMIPCRTTTKNSSSKKWV
jgi:hypothetical protein